MVTWPFATVRSGHTSSVGINDAGNSLEFNYGC